MKKHIILWVLFSCIIIACSEDDAGNSGVSYLPLDEGKMPSCTDGIEIAYQIWRYDGAAEATLIFVNGRQEYTDKYHHLVDMFNRPFDIIMYDHMGQGRSGGTRAHADDFDTQHVCDLNKILDEHASKSLPIAIVAHSMGGYISTRFAELYPDKAQIYVMSSPMYGIPVPDGMTIELVTNLAETNVESGNAEVSTAGEETPETPTCENNVLTHDCDMYNSFKDNPLFQIGDPTWGWVNAAIKGFESLFAEVDKITKPFLIMQAGDEQIVIPEKEKEFCDLLGGGLCEFKVFEGDYHELFMEKDREQVVKTTVEFIDKKLSSL